MNINTEKKIAAFLSITSNAIIILLKIIAGIITGSISIISEAIHSFSDFLASILTFYAVSRSGEPADKEHPFGHGKYEDMSGFIEGGLIILAGLYIIYESIKKLFSGYNAELESLTGIFVMAFAVIANFLVSSYLFHVAKKSDSVSLYADAEHLRTDIFSSLGVLVGLIIIKITGFVIIDPIIAIIVAIIILKAGYAISKETLNNLLDGSLPEEDMKKIEAILQATENIKGYKNLKTRKSGKVREIEITVFFDADMKICECHNICDSIEAQMAKVLASTRVLIHAEPVCYKKCCNDNNCNC